MHRDNTRFGLLYYYCLLLSEASPNYMTDSRCPHLLNRYQCILKCFTIARGPILLMEIIVPLWRPSDVTLFGSLSLGASGFGIISTYTLWFFNPMKKTVPEPTIVILFYQDYAILGIGIFFSIIIALVKYFDESLIWFYFYTSLLSCII